MAADTTIERGPTVALWRDLWRHVEELRAENQSLRSRLGLKPRKYRLKHHDVPAGPFEFVCEHCGGKFIPERRQGVSLYCSDGCRDEVHRMAHRRRDHAQHG